MWDIILKFVLDQGLNLALKFGIPYAVDKLFNWKWLGIGNWLKINMPDLAQDLENLMELLKPHNEELKAERQAVAERRAKQIRSIFGPADTKGVD